MPDLASGAASLRAEPVAGKAPINIELRLGSAIVLRGTLHHAALQSGPATVSKSNAGELSFEWASASEPSESTLRLDIVARSDGEFDLHWTLRRAEYEESRWRVEDVYDLASGKHWFGGGELCRQHWPLETLAWEARTPPPALRFPVSFSSAFARQYTAEIAPSSADATRQVGPYYPFDNGPNGLGNLLHPLFFTSSGAAIAIDPALPYLHLGLNPVTPPPADRLHNREFVTGFENFGRALLPLVDGAEPGARRGDGLLHVQARPYDDDGIRHPLGGWRAPVLPAAPGRPGACSVLRYTLSAQRHARAAMERLLAGLPRAPAPPPACLFREPIWTTWARYKMDVTQERVLEFAEEIAGHGFARSVMEIDDRWSAEYGDLEFDPLKFPDPAAMVRRLHQMGFRVTLWVTPFANEASDAYQEGAAKGYWVKASREPGERGVGAFRWWQPGGAAALDVTNPAALEWYNAGLRRLQEKYGIDGFKFDGGEACFLPKRPEPGCGTHAPLTAPGAYTAAYVRGVAAKFPLCEVRCGYGTQELPLLVREWDRFSTWGLDNGLRSLVTAALAFGAMGYPFVLPDMIGGNAYGNVPERELVIRWAQANALLPSMQFSIAPWDYYGRDAAVLEGTWVESVARSVLGNDRARHAVSWAVHAAARAVLKARHARKAARAAFASRLHRAASACFGARGAPPAPPAAGGGASVFDEKAARSSGAEAVSERLLDARRALSDEERAKGDETVRLCREAVRWHLRAAPLILRLADEAAATGRPIVRPLFWVAPEDAEAAAVGDQFCLGDDVIVAPVMEKGAVARDVYLPAGRWRDVLRSGGELRCLGGGGAGAGGEDVVLEGGRWHRAYPAPLDFLPWFERC
eukprot:tig00000849_g4746.t1